MSIKAMKLTTALVTPVAVATGAPSRRGSGERGRSLSPGR
jgi:hypothetical protein